jgi:hypothetical protein
MTANTAAASRRPDARTNFGRAWAATHTILVVFAGRIHGLVIAGQLGADTERELGRRTGART